MSYPPMSSGLPPGPRRASRNAGTWAIAAAGVTLILGVVWLILAVAGFSTVEGTGGVTTG